MLISKLKAIVTVAWPCACLLDEENARLIKENFVAVSVSNYDQGARMPSVILQGCQMQLPGTGGSQWP